MSDELVPVLSLPFGRASEGAAFPHRVLLRSPVFGPRGEDVVVCTAPGVYQYRHAHDLIAVAS